MEKERIRSIVTRAFAETFEPVFVTRLEEFVTMYRKDLISRYEWYKAFGFETRVEGKESISFDLMPIEDLVITKITNNIYEENQKGN